MQYSQFFFNPSGHSLARHTLLLPCPCKRRVQATSKRAFPSGPDTAVPPPRIEPRLPLSSPLVKQRGAAPPASCKQAPSWAEAPAPTTDSTKRPPLRQYPSPQHNPRQHQDLIAARPAMEPREGPHTLRDARVWSTNGSSSSSGDRRAREAHRPQIPLH